MRKNKYNAEKVVGCPYCWGAWGDPAMKKKYINEQKFCAGCHEPARWADTIVFDSLVEFGVGHNLKLIEKSGKITGLQHHEKVIIRPDVYFDKCDWRFSFDKHGKKENRLAEPTWRWESDFSYIQDGETRFVEAKRLDTRKTKRGAIVREPFFAKGEKKKYKLICSYLRARDLEVQLMCNGEIWLWNEKFTKLEVVR